LAAIGIGIHWYIYRDEALKLTARASVSPVGFSHSTGTNPDSDVLRPTDAEFELVPAVIPEIDVDGLLGESSVSLRVV
jgi:hypothetical protein